ncbi:MAG: CDP-glycerol glycerophosphotransferase family protein, partial [Bifidobacteriaceae bacterium]|nr:CDP-glycerol glycerophosphotransferase family protein [Bifidobacteriaceae bacterium]
RAVNDGAIGKNLLEENLNFETSSQIKDVTQWDDVNDLIIASDLGVFDYSSIRFDYAQTGKPMIFFVPDLEKYKEAREFLIPYEPTAPGPKIETEEELIKKIKTFDSWFSEFSNVYKDFLHKYTPGEDGQASKRVNKIVFGIN